MADGRCDICGTTIASSPEEGQKWFSGLCQHCTNSNSATKQSQQKNHQEPKLAFLCAIVLGMLNIKIGYGMKLPYYLGLEDGKSTLYMPTLLAGIFLPVWLGFVLGRFIHKKFF